MIPQDLQPVWDILVVIAVIFIGWAARGALKDKPRGFGNEYHEERRARDARERRK